MRRGEAMLHALFWLSAAGIVYAYAAYPIVIAALARLFGSTRAAPEAPRTPRVALLIAAYNEGAVLEARLLNALALDYPSESLQIVVASDGSDDSTPDICGRFRDRITTFLFQERRGKAATLNAAVERIEADILVLSDANTFMDAAALRHLARWFDDPGVGAVCGRLVLTDSATGRNADGLYWRYETFLKEREARLGGLLGANGAIYAIRRDLFRPLPAGTIVDDFVLPLAARLRSRCRLVYEPEAVAHEETAPGLREEFGRRARIGLGGWQALGLLWPLLGPRYGWTAFTLWSHKVLRWVCPFLMIGAIGSAATLAAHPLYASLAVAQAIGYMTAAALARLPGSTPWRRRLRLLPMFVGMNLALLVGFARWLRARPSGTWTRTTRRPAEAAAGDPDLFGLIAASPSTPTPPPRARTSAAPAGTAAAPARQRACSRP
jgi:cellulose synthase/poly-beta-1,6-N-acetylglucosamine synthase-like glycosyltransferase